MKEYKQERDKGGMFTGRIIKRDIVSPLKDIELKRFESYISPLESNFTKLEKVIARAKKNGEKYVFIGGIIPPDVFVGYGSVSEAEFFCRMYERNLGFYKELIKETRKENEQRKQI